jgi:hypothetical protein
VSALPLVTLRWTGHSERMAVRGFALAMLCASLLACGSDAARPAGSESAGSPANSAPCESLAVERDLPAPPPAASAGTRSLASAVQLIFSGSLPGEPAHITVVITPEGASDLEAVAATVRSIPGVEITKLLDQAAVRDALVSDFSAGSAAAEGVPLDSFPAEIEASAASDAALDALRVVTTGLAAVKEVHDDRISAARTRVRAQVVSGVFGHELSALDTLTGPASAVAAAIRRFGGGSSDPSQAEIAAAAKSARDLLALAASDCGLAASTNS